MKAKDVKVETDNGDGMEAEAETAESMDTGDTEEETKEKPRVVDRRRVREDGEVERGGRRGGRRNPARARLRGTASRRRSPPPRRSSRNMSRRSTRTRRISGARQEREMERRTQEVKKQAVSGFLGIADDLARATAAVDGGAAEGEEGKTLETLVQGVRMIQGRFFQELSNLGVEPLPAMGAAFNPEEHEAVRMIEVDDEAQDGLVVEELACGYKLGDAVLRPARVSVGKYAGPRSDSRP